MKITEDIRNDIYLVLVFLVFLVLLIAMFTYHDKVIHIFNPSRP